jgi:hypothetical protein
MHTVECKSSFLSDPRRLNIDTPVWLSNLHNDVVISVVVTVPIDHIAHQLCKGQFTSYWDSGIRNWRQ